MTFAPLRVLALSALAVAHALASPTSAAAQTKLLRFPDIHGDRVVFTLRAATSGWRRSPAARATRLTAHPGMEVFAQLLARRQVDRLHRPVRRRRAGLRHARDGRRAEAAHVLPGARAADAALGLRQPGLRLDRRRQARSCSARCATAWTLPITRLYTVAGDGRPGRAAADAGVGRRRLLARRQARRLLAALPRLPHREALRRRPGQRPVHLRPRDPRRDADHRHPRADRDPMWIGDTIYFNSDRNGTLQPLRLRRRLEADDTPVTSSTTWDVRWPSADQQAGASSTSWTASCSCSTRRRGKATADRHHRARRRPGAKRPAASRRRGRSRTSSCARRASGRCSRRAATSSPRRSRRGRRAT